MLESAVDLSFLPTEDLEVGALLSCREVVSADTELVVEERIPRDVPAGVGGMPEELIALFCNGDVRPASLVMICCTQ